MIYTARYVYLRFYSCGLNQRVWPRYLPAVQMSLKSNVNNTKENKSSTRIQCAANILYILYIYNIFHTVYNIYCIILCILSCGPDSHRTLYVFFLFINYYIFYSSPRLLYIFSRKRAYCENPQKISETVYNKSFYYF